MIRKLTYFGFLEIMNILLITLLSLVAVIHATEFTFELPDNAQECFHEVIDRNVDVSLEYQVVAGGNYDVDMELTSPNGLTLYKEQRKQYDMFQWKTEQRGEFKFCFSNEFSTFTHKIIYFHLKVGDEEDKPLFTGPKEQHHALTAMEQSTQRIRDFFTTIEDQQTHYKLREFQGRLFAEELAEGVQFWSIGVVIAICVIGFAEVIILRSFFSDSSKRQVVIVGRR